MLRRRVILYPQGPARTALGREHCAALAHHCGGDLQRVIERPGGFADFLEHARRLVVLREGRDDVLVVLTRTYPLSLLLPTRRALEESIPWLQQAVWTLFWDPDSDPALPDAAAELGTLSGPLEYAPIWTAPNGMTFLVLSPLVVDPTELEGRVRALSEMSPRHSEIRLTARSRTLGEPASR